jgi:hypothetical protein
MTPGVRTLRVITLVTGCAAIALWMLVHRDVPLAPFHLFGLWLIACCVGEAFWTRAPGGEGTISMALALDIAALGMLGHSGGVEVVAASTLIGSAVSHRRPWHRVLFNVAQATLAAGAALVINDLVRSAPGGSALPVSWISVFVMGGVFFAVNTGLVTLAISLSTSAPLWRTWHERFGYTFELASSLAQMTLAGFVVTTYAQIGPVSLLFLLPLLAVLGMSSAREAHLRSPLTQDSSRPDRLRRAA